MVKSITTEELEAQRNDKTDLHHSFEYSDTYRDRFCHGSCWDFQLGRGLNLTVFDEAFQTTLEVENEHDETVPLISKFYLSGNHRVLTSNVGEVGEDYLEQAGQHYLFFLPNIREIEIYPAKQQLRYVRIFWEIDYLRSYIRGFSSVPAALQHLVEGKPLKRFYQPLGNVTTQMQQILLEIVNCPFQDLTKRMYLEAKTLELLSLQFSQWIGDEKLSISSPTLKKDDIERLHQAKKLLTCDLNNPPSLLELARQVGLNDRKLKQGFRQVFSTTVFGYLYDYRMEQARQLLTDTQMTISAIAHRVGYKNPGDFSTAFRRKFGSAPRTYVNRE
jgi:AraC family transcriptional regulator, transcriptional activator of the genes for pyochelin and ferripyochelin receptors